MQQTTMTGDDWTSDRDKRRTSQRQAARKKAALDCAKKLDAACEALSAFLRACNDCSDGSGDTQRGISDGRQMMIRDLAEYSGYLESKYGSTQ